MSFGTILYTWFFGNFVGSDELSNKYYCNSKDFQDKNAKRWVIFNGEIEASNIPPHWHAWLHKSIESPPIHYKHKYEWQKDLKPNTISAVDSIHPKNYLLSRSKSNFNKKEYEKWKP